MLLNIDFYQNSTPESFSCVRILSIIPPHHNMSDQILSIFSLPRVGFTKYSGCCVISKSDRPNNLGNSSITSTWTAQQNIMVLPSMGCEASLGVSFFFSDYSMLKWEMISWENAKIIPPLNLNAVGSFSTSVVLTLRYPELSDAHIFEFELVHRETAAMKDPPRGIQWLVHLFCRW